MSSPRQPPSSSPARHSCRSQLSSAQAAEAVTVSSSAQLTAALKSARAGQTITVKDGTYTGKFTGTASGTASAPIKLVGIAKAVLTTGSSSSGYSLYLTGSYWNVSGLTVSKGQKGIVLDNSDNTVIDGVTVQSTGQEAIHLRKGSSNVVVRNSLVQNTGLTHARLRRRNLHRQCQEQLGQDHGVLVDR